MPHMIPSRQRPHAPEHPPAWVLLFLLPLGLLGACTKSEVAKPPQICPITVTSPKGGESWPASSRQTITWSQTGGNCGATVLIELLRDGAVCRAIASGVPNNGGCPWDSVGRCGNFTDLYKIRVTDWYTGASGESRATFTIPNVPCSLRLTSPHGGESWPTGTSQTIVWSGTGSCGSTVKIEVLRSGAVCRTLASGIPNSGSWTWSPVVQCGGVANDYKIRLTDWDTGAAVESDAPFSIPFAACVLAVTSPNGGESWPTGTSQTIAWSDTGSCGSTVKIEVLLSGAVCQTLASGIPNSGSWTWSPVEQCGGIANDYKIRLTDLDAGATDESDAPFSIPPAACVLTVTSPNGGESWPASSRQTITWRQAGGNCGSTVLIELLRNGEDCRLVAGGIPNNGEFTWESVGWCSNFTDLYKIRVTDWQMGASDESDATFSIPTVPCSMRLTSPHGGESWPTGTSQTIAWSDTGMCGSTVKIEVLQNGAVCRTLASGIPNNGSWTWSPVVQCGGVANDYKIRLTDWDSGATVESDAPFSIPSATCVLAVTSPNGGERWQHDSSQMITWEKSGNCGPTVLLQLSMNGSICKTIADGVPNSGSYAWNPVVGCDHLTNYSYKVRVTDWNTGASDESDGGFGILADPCTLTITSPNGGERWVVGSRHAITWTRQGGCGSMYWIELLRNGGACADIASGVGSGFEWTVQQCGGQTDGYQIMVGDFYTTATDKSDAPFSIPFPACSLSVASPNGGESWPAGSSQTITWSRSGQCGPTARIELLRNGAPCDTIASGVPNSGTYTWNPVAPCGGETDGYMIRVTDWNTGGSDESDAPFSIPPGQPRAGERGP